MTPDDHAAIVGDLTSFWDSDRTRHLHHPMFAREFAVSAASVVEHGLVGLKAITTPANTASLEFHRALGFVDRLVTDYSGPAQDRIVMECDVHAFAV